MTVNIATGAAKKNKKNKMPVDEVLHTPGLSAGKITCAAKHRHQQKRCCKARLELRGT